jgi:hypothetical protein
LADGTATTTKQRYGPDAETVASAGKKIFDR